MVKITIEPGQTVDTTDPHVLVTVNVIPSLVAASLKVVLIVETADGRQSGPTELLLTGGGAPPS